MEADRTCIILQIEAATNLRMTRLMTDRSRPLRDSNQTAKRPNTLHGSLLVLVLLLVLLWNNIYRINESTNNNNNILARLNLPKLQSRRRHPDTLILVNVFTYKTYCNSVLNTVSLCKPTRFIRHHSVVYLILCIVRRSVLQPDVFLPVMLSVGISIISNSCSISRKHMIKYNYFISN
jgi:ABC-type maltose transport system permease subunit